jgi:hypothetical protein
MGHRGAGGRGDRPDRRGRRDRIRQRQRQLDDDHVLVVDHGADDDHNADHDGDDHHADDDRCGSPRPQSAHQFEPFHFYFRAHSVSRMAGVSFEPPAILLTTAPATNVTHAPIKTYQV